MNQSTSTLPLAWALIALLSLIGCGAVRSATGGKKTYGYPFVKAGARLSVATTSLATEETRSGAESRAAARVRVRDVAARLSGIAPDVIAIRDGSMWQEDAAILHDDIEILLDELYRLDLPYEIAAQVDVLRVPEEGATRTIRHLVLVRADLDVTVEHTSSGRYAQGDDGWVEADLDTPQGTVRIVATGLDRGHGTAPVDEFLYAPTVPATETILACGLSLEDPAIDALFEAGFEMGVQMPDRGVLLTRVASHRGSRSDRAA